MSDVSDLFALLAAAHRRRLLLVLCERESVSLPEAVMTQAAAAGDEGGRSASTSGTEPPPGEGSAGRDTTADPDRLKIELRHRDLPKLEARRLVEWNPDAGTVSRGPAFDEVEPALEVLAEGTHAFPGDLR